MACPFRFCSPGRRPTPLGAPAGSPWTTVAPTLRCSTSFAVRAPVTGRGRAPSSRVNTAAASGANPECPTRVPPVGPSSTQPRPPRRSAVVAVLIFDRISTLVLRLRLRTSAACLDIIEDYVPRLSGLVGSEGRPFRMRALGHSAMAAAVWVAPSGLPIAAAAFAGSLADVQGAPAGPWWAR